MAISPKDTYGVQIDTSDPTGYPEGAAMNDGTPGDGTGTPLEKAWVNDWFGFVQAALSDAAVAFSGNPEKVGASDVVAAILKMIDRGRHGARFAVGGVSIADGDNLEIGLQQAGYNTYSVNHTNNDIRAPETGLYFVSFTGTAAIANASNPAIASVSLELSGLSHGRAYAKRFNTTTGEYVGFSASAIVEIASTSTDKLTLLNVSGVPITLAASSIVNIHRIGPLP